MSGSGWVGWPGQSLTLSVRLEKKEDREKLGWGKR